jgi:hypothetical protein
VSYQDIIVFKLNISDKLPLYYQDEEDTPLSVLQDMYRLFREESDDTMMNSVDFKMTFLLIM